MRSNAEPVDIFCPNQRSMGSTRKGSENQVMTGKLSRPTISYAALWHILLAFADFRIPKPVTELMVFPACLGKPAYYVCPRCKITMEREFMSFCDRCGQRLDWHGYRYAKIIYPDARS